MDQPTVITTSGTASNLRSNEQHPSAGIQSQYDIPVVFDNEPDFLAAILPEKQYRVVAGQLFIIRQGSPPARMQ